VSYLKIYNLYKDQNILLLKECYALEKLDGTSAHVRWGEGQLAFFAGGASHETFIKLFNQEQLKESFIALGIPLDKQIVVYGEAYGGKIQAMSATYGKELKFCAFEVRIGDSWLSVPEAEAIVLKLGLDFVPYKKIATDLASIDAERDAPSAQAVKCGILEARKREGVILRPLVELTLNNGSRVIAKHKRDDFRETATPREVNTDKLQVLEEANAIANEWCTLERLKHIVSKSENHSMERIPEMVKEMIDDINIEGKGELVFSKEAGKAIGKKTVEMYKEFLKGNLYKT